MNLDVLIVISRLGENRLPVISTLCDMVGIADGYSTGYSWHGINYILVKARMSIINRFLSLVKAKFSYSMKKNLRDRFKIYAIDTGLRNRVAFSFSEDSGWLAENVVMNHLKAGGDEIYYAGNGAETDFVVRERQRVTKRIQVWYADPAETVIPERELLGFTAPSIPKTGGPAAPTVNLMHPDSVGDAVETCRNLLITNDLEGIRRLGNTEITCIPLPLFLIPF